MSTAKPWSPGLMKRSITLPKLPGTGWLEWESGVSSCVVDALHAFSNASITLILYSLHHIQTNPHQYSPVLLFLCPTSARQQIRGQLNNYALEYDQIFRFKVNSIFFPPSHLYEKEDWFWRRKPFCHCSRQEAWTTSISNSANTTAPGGPSQAGPLWEVGVYSKQVNTALQWPKYKFQFFRRQLKRHNVALDLFNLMSKV